MALITIEEGKSKEQFEIEPEKMKYLRKFIHSIQEEDEEEEEFSLKESIEQGLREVKAMQEGKLPKTTLKELLDEIRD
jgi:hypothetical protein